MPKLLIITLLIITFSSCKKNSNNVANALIGSWRGEKWSFSISNFAGTPDPFCVTKRGDSLFIKLMPAIDLRYKLIKVSSTSLIVSENDVIFTYTRFKIVY